MNIFQIMNLINEKHPNLFYYDEMVKITNGLSDHEILNNLNIALEFIEEINLRYDLKLLIEFKEEKINMFNYRILFGDLKISYGDPTESDFNRINFFVSIIILSKNSTLFKDYIKNLK